LGSDVFSTGEISPERTEKLLKAVNVFKILVDVNDVVAFDAVATSAMREASNSAEIIAQIENQYGIRIRIISGQEEAKIIREAGEIKTDSAFPMRMFIDVGGGSTEISVMKDNVFVNSQSFNIGTLRILSEKVDPDEWERLNRWLMQFQPYFGQIECVGSGGNINKITKQFGDKETKSISYKLFDKAYKNLARLSVKERMDSYNLRADRADVIVPASDIYLRIMKTIEAQYILAPKFGLADGLIVDLYKTYQTAKN
jgi:exopolyphosphatase/guanosine-5'-triphosphate,3'-diphosphate pyrophosphatase